MGLVGHLIGQTSCLLLSPTTAVLPLVDGLAVLQVPNVDLSPTTAEVNHHPQHRVRASSISLAVDRWKLDRSTGLHRCGDGRAWRVTIVTSQTIGRGRE
jgi:hypothetical protein